MAYTHGEQSVVVFPSRFKVVGISLRLKIMARFLESKAYYKIQHVAVSYTHLRAHETVLDLVCRLLLEKKK